MDEEKKALIALNRWQAKYIMDLHDIRFKLVKKMEGLNVEEIKQLVRDVFILEFPSIQTSALQEKFRKIGTDNVDQSDLQKAMKLLYYMEEK